MNACSPPVNACTLSLSLFNCYMQRLPTCGDTDADGAAGPTYANCAAGFEYDLAKASILLDTNNEGDCCKVRLLSITSQ